MRKLKRDGNTIIEDDRWKKKGGPHKKTHKQLRRKQHMLEDMTEDQQLDWLLEQERYINDDDIVADMLAELGDNYE